MRSRNIKPGFFKNEELAELPPEARLLYIGLWCLADREGRLEDRPKRIKAEIFPYENRNVDALLSKLEEAGFIHRYKPDVQLECLNGCSGYISIPKFRLHQNPHRNEKPSEIPAPGDFAKLREDSGTSTQALRLIPSSLIPSSHTPPIVPPKGEFEKFWSIYPRREGKGRARSSFAAAAKKKPAPEIIAALEERLPELGRRERQFIPLPATWLNQERWADEIVVPPGHPAHVPFVPPEAPELSPEELEESKRLLHEISQGIGKEIT